MFVKSLYGGRGLSTLNANTDRRFFVFSWLPMYKLYVFCHGRFLSRPLITLSTLRPLAFMYPENMSLKISPSFPLGWTLVATGQELNHVMHKTRVRPQTALPCKSSLGKTCIDYTQKLFLNVFYKWHLLDTILMDICNFICHIYAQFLCVSLGAGEDSACPRTP